MSEFNQGKAGINVRAGGGQPGLRMCISSGVKRMPMLAGGRGWRSGEAAVYENLSVIRRVSAKRKGIVPESRR